MYTPVYPSFTHDIKVGYEGYTFHGHLRLLDFTLMIFTSGDWQYIDIRDADKANVVTTYSPGQIRQPGHKIVQKHIKIKGKWAKTAS